MNSRLILAMIFGLGTLVGCASNDEISASPAATHTATVASGTSAPEGVCDSDPAESAVGKKFSDDLLEKSRKLAGAHTARALRPDDVITTEYDPQRLNLRLDDSSVVQSVNCG